MSGKYNEPNFLSLIPEEEEAGGICFSKLMIVTQTRSDTYHFCVPKIELLQTLPYLVTEERNIIKLYCCNLIN